MARPKSKAVITWLGEDDLMHEDAEGNIVHSYPPDKETPPRQTTWNGIVFKKGEPVEVSNKHMIAKAKGNQFFEVDGVRANPEADEDDAD